MNEILLILWIIVLIVDIVEAACGASANWILVFCPLITLIFTLVDNMLEEIKRKIERKNFLTK